MQALADALDPATIIPPIFPGPLILDPNPPDAATLFHRIDISALWNLYRATDDNVRYEKTTYGYWNSVLQSIFSLSRGYQIEVQYPVRRDLGHRFGTPSTSSIGGVLLAIFVRGAGLPYNAHRGGLDVILFRERHVLVQSLHAHQRLLRRRE